MTDHRSDELFMHPIMIIDGLTNLGLKRRRAGNEIRFWGDVVTIAKIQQKQTEGPFFLTGTILDTLAHKNPSSNLQRVGNPIAPKTIPHAHIHGTPESLAISPGNQTGGPLRMRGSLCCSAMACCSSM